MSGYSFYFSILVIQIKAHIVILWATFRFRVSLSSCTYFYSRNLQTAETWVDLLFVISYM